MALLQNTSGLSSFSVKTSYYKAHVDTQVSNGILGTIKALCSHVWFLWNGRNLNAADKASKAEYNQCKQALVSERFSTHSTPQKVVEQIKRFHNAAMKRLEFLHAAGAQLSTPELLCVTTNAMKHDLESEFGSDIRSYHPSFDIDPIFAACDVATLLKCAEEYKPTTKADFYRYVHDLVNTKLFNGGNIEATALKLLQLMKDVQGIYFLSDKFQAKAEQDQTGFLKFFTGEKNETEFKSFFISDECADFLPNEIAGNLGFFQIEKDEIDSAPCAPEPSLHSLFTGVENEHLGSDALVANLRKTKVESFRKTKVATLSVKVSDTPFDQLLQKRPSSPQSARLENLPELTAEVPDFSEILQVDTLDTLEDRLQSWGLAH